MSHRKFEAPRCGNLGFLPRKRAKHPSGKIKTFPKDDASAECHLTAFMGYKAGMTHIMRECMRPGAKIHKKEVVEAVTLIECPPMVVIGLVGYVETPLGLRTCTTVWAEHLNDDVKRRFYKSWYKSKKKAFTKYVKKYADGKAGKEIEDEIEKLKKNCTVIRILAHSQIRKLGLRQKKAQLMEIQVNGGSIADKIKTGRALFEKTITVDSIFSMNEVIDTCSTTRGRGTQGVTTRWGVTRLPRKTHRGLRKVACVGSWHPAGIGYSVPRAGQHGYHHRTEMNKKIYQIGKALKNADGKESGTFQASTEHDLTEKNITPMGGFPHYGVINEDYIMLKGAVPGPRKRPITLRKALQKQTKVWQMEKINLKFIDTSSKFGHGRFQTHAEKIKFMGPQKVPIGKAPYGIL